MIDNVTIIVDGEQIDASELDVDVLPLLAGFDDDHNPIYTPGLTTFTIHTSKGDLILNNKPTRMEIGDNVVYEWGKQAMNQEGHDELAILGAVHVGMRDIDTPCLWFDATVLTGGTFFVFVGEEMLDFISNAGVYDLTTLVGKACVVRRTDAGYLFIRLTP